MHQTGFEFNKEKLFLRFNGLYMQYFERFKDVKMIKGIETNLRLFSLYHDEFLFRSYYAYSILKRMRLLKEKALKPQFEGLKANLNISDEEEILYSSFITREYIYFVMPFLNTLFILQDRIMILLGCYLKVKEKYDKLPSYYFNFKKNKENNLLALYPRPIQQLLVKYWEKYGEKIRQYRNLEQHQYQLYYHSYYRFKPKEEYVLYLPDEIKKNMDLEEIKYHKKIVALELFEEQFKAFHDFVDRMLIQLKIPPEQIQSKQAFEPLEGLSQYKNGELLSTMIIGNEAINFRIGRNNDPNSKAKTLEINKIPNTITSFKWEFK